MNIWDDFEHVTWINLLEKEDRYEAAKKRFDAVGLGTKIKFYRPN